MAQAAKQLQKLDLSGEWTGERGIVSGPTQNRGVVRYSVMGARPCIPQHTLRMEIMPCMLARNRALGKLNVMAALPGVAPYSLSSLHAPPS